MITDINAAIAIVKQYTGIAETDNRNDIVLLSMLEASKGVESYRPFICAAMHLWAVAASSRGQLISADGVTWLKPSEIAETLNGLLTMQESFDAALTGIPVGWDVGSKRSQIIATTNKTSTYNASVGFVV